METLITGGIWYFVFLLSTVLHETAHAWVAKFGGDATAARSGQLTLDPTPHIRREPFGMVVVPILSFALGGWMIGWASVPLDPQWAHRHPHRAGWMSLAGPAANLVLLLIATAALKFGLARGVFSVPAYSGFDSLVIGGSDSMTLVATFVSILFSLNLILFLFNLLPIPPLDGATAINLLLPEDMARRVQTAMAQPMLALIGLIVAWNVFPRVFSPIYRTVLYYLY